MQGKSVNLLPLPALAATSFSEPAIRPAGGGIRASKLADGTPRLFPRFSGMRIREENCNMVLLAAVALVSVAIAGGATLVGSADNSPVRLTDRTTSYAERPRSPDKQIIYVSDQPSVRLIGAPFVPNTNPRER
jgi:hypothetical protein